MVRLSEEMKISAKIKRQYAILLTLAVLGHIVRVFIFPQLDPWDNLYMLAASLVLVIGVWESFKFLNRYLSKTYPIDQRPVTRVVVQLLSGAIILFIIREIGIRWIGKLLPVEFTWQFRTAVYAVDFFFSACLNGGFFIQEYFRRWKAQIERAEKLEKEKTQVQFDNLKNQLNPHFLFNALTSLNSLIYSDQDLASDFLQNLSRVYRYLLQHKDKEQVSLQTEVDFIQDYIFLLDTRFGRAFQVKFILSEQAKERGIVPVTLQILIENAIKHNVLNEMRPLSVEIMDEGEYLIVRNNLQRKKTVESSNQQGMENLKTLYRFLSPYNVMIEETPHYFTVKIPLLK